MTTRPGNPLKTKTDKQRRIADLARALDDADQSIEAHRRLLASWRTTFNGLRRELRREIGTAKVIRVVESRRGGSTRSSPEKT